MTTKLILGLALVGATAHVTAASAAGCPKKIDVGKKWIKDTDPQSAGLGDDWTWKVGLGSEVRLVGDCNEIGIVGSVALRATAFIVTVNAVEATLSATTDVNHHQSVDLGLYAADLEIESYTIADSDDHLEDSMFGSHVLPLLDDSTTSVVNVGLGFVTYGVDYELVGLFMGSAHYEVQPKHLEAGLYAYADIHASMIVSTETEANLDVDDDTETVTVSAGTTLKVFRGYADASGEFTETYKEPPKTETVMAAAQPSINNAWLVEGSAGYYIYDALEGAFVIAVDAPGVFRGLHFDVTVFELAGLPSTFPFSNAWSYSKTYFKPF